MILKCWADLPGYTKFVKEQWLSYQVFGWSGYVLKEKMKLLKGSLRSWHQNHTQNLDIKICGAKDRMSVLDIKAEGEGLEDLRKLSWVKWDTLCLHRENGGFGPGSGGWRSLILLFLVNGRGGCWRKEEACGIMCCVWSMVRRGAFMCWWRRGFRVVANSEPY